MGETLGAIFRVSGAEGAHRVGICLFVLGVPGLLRGCGSVGQLGLLAAHAAAFL